MGDGKESCIHESSSDHMHGNGPPPMMAPPNMMYYPQGMGYNPGYAPQPMPHQGYAPYHNEYPNMYHYPAGPYFTTPPTYHNAGGSKAFLRGFIMCSCLIFAALFVATLIMALLLHPQLPIYTVNSLSVSNFNTTPTLIADWNTSIIIKNINQRLNGFFSNFKVDLLHQDDLVAVSYLPDFQLDDNEVKEIVATPSSNGFLFTKWNLDDMAKEQAAGSIMLTLRITSMVAFKSKTMSSRGALILALCDGLKVVFANNTSNGVLDNAGGPIGCQLYM
ncbi:hypothetical protein VNO78_17912 [Psophocarpus tetragonolobus]|uniref:Late embryogenesis abundant protein LEA-2 subgroup domain-containing protein n=1 Tax=Psophocarpus tetragonolobus TaxID=3891 RepID=A0AAN9SJM2_PSOTE